MLMQKRRSFGRGARDAWRAAPALVLLLVTASCATFGTERHLAPIFTELSTAGGGVEIEALGGAVRVRRTTPGGFFEQWALRPFVIHDREPNGHTLTRFLTPLGHARDQDSEYTWQLLPVTRYDRTTHPDGDTEWTLITLPGIYWARTRDGRTLRAWFPFGGVFENFLSFDRLEFVLFPLFARSERAGRITYHFLFPIFAYTYGNGGPSGRFWPFYGRSKFEGSYDRGFVLWPIFHWQHNNLSLPPEKQEHKWMVFPLVGGSRRGTYRATTLLWPFFGYARDPATSFWSWDGPWPLVRFLRSPEEGVSRSRVWPFYSHYQGDGLESTWYLWPIFNERHEEYEKASKNSVYVLPFWQSWKRVDADAGRSSFEKLWPLFQTDRSAPQSRSFAFPALNPLWRTPEIDDMYAWIYELYTRKRDHDHVSERSWLGLWRRETDAAEDRASFVGLWARRRYRAEHENVTEVSTLFGLLRWRIRASRSVEWLSPALPGPGWPLARASEPLEDTH